MFLICGVPVFAQIAPGKPGGSEEAQKKVDLPAKKRTNGDTIRRWFEVDQLSIATRFRYIGSNSNVTLASQAQYQFAARARFKFDAKGKYTVYAGLFTGSTFPSGWNNSGWGTGPDRTNIYLKKLYFNARPVAGLEVQIGGIGVYNGENTEITGLDNDGYLMGERIQIRRPKELFFDEIALTNAFLGDASTPNVFRRFKHLNKSNYRQVMVRKRIGKRASLSADYTFESGRDTLHQAVSFYVPELQVVDRMVFENYQRIAPSAGFGFAIHGEKKLHSRLTVNGGFSRIDMPMLNSDRFGPGKRFFVTGDLKITREFTLNSAVIHAVGELPTAATPRTRVDLMVSYNLLETLRRLKIF